MHQLRTASVIAILAIAAFACESEPTSEPSIVTRDRSPLGVDRKPLVDSATGPIVADELLVHFSDALPGGAATWIARVAGGEVTYVAPRSGYAVVRFADAADAAAGAARLQASGLVADVARNHVLHGESGTSGTGIGTSPSTTIGELQWNLYALGLDPFVPRPGAAGIAVAVLDTGVAYESYSDERGTYLQAPTLSGVTFAPGYDFVNDDAHPNDDQRHGTHIAGVIAASSGIASLAPGATILPIKVLDSGNSGTELALAEGIRFATDQGARVINMSLAFPPTYFPSRLLQSAIDYAAQHGVIMIAAAGNHGEDLVAYPAAFRDVIAVGASELPGGFAAGIDAPSQWQAAQANLVRAPYSNRSYKIDVLAPGGIIGSDANADGLPEAVLAQTFAPGDPTSFGYYFYAGTSQAAAEVSGVVASMLALDPTLDAFAVRGILVESSAALGGFMSTDGGRGVLRADLALAAAAAGDAHASARERFNANVVVTLHDGPDGTRARARVEVLEATTGAPAAGVSVYGLFTGAAFATASAVSNDAGVAEVWSEPLAGNLVVAFQVDAVARGAGADASFDRPRGFLRVESRSLDRLSSFAEALPASASSSGTGIGTSPSNPDGLPGLELTIDGQNLPVTIGFDPALFAADGYRSTLLLPNFSWGLATAPMAVAIDEAWFLSSFPTAGERRVVSRGSGLSDSPLSFDDASFAVAPPAPAADVPSVPLIVLTFSSGTGIGTSPSLDPTEPTGLGTSPSVSGTGLGTSPSLPISRLIVDRAYSGIDGALAHDIDRVLTGVLAAGSGIGTSPSFTLDGPWAFSADTFGGLSTLAGFYGGFASLPVAAPAGSYGATLGAAVMPMAPVAPESDGPGVGYVPLP